MGCACVKSDVVVKNQKVSKNIEENQVSNSKENRSAREESSNRNGRNREVNSNNNNNVQGSNHVNMENQVHNSNNLNSRAGQRNSQSQSNQSAVVRHQSSNNHQRQSSSQVAYNRMFENIRSDNNISNNLSGNVPYLPSSNDPNYNFPTIDDVYIGSGLKKMKGYKSNLSKEDLQKKRNEFWGTRVEGNSETWEFLKNICENQEINESDIKEFLNAAGVTPINNCINLTYDSRGYYYEVPNYCINDPYVVELPPHLEKKRPNENLIEIIVRKVVEDKKYQIKNTSKVSELKAQVSHNFFEYEVEINNLRLFFGGKELNNDEELWYYRIDEGSIVIMLVRQND